MGSPRKKDMKESNSMVCPEQIRDVCEEMCHGFSEHIAEEKCAPWAEIVS